MTNLPSAREVLHAKLSDQRHAAESLRNTFTHPTLQAHCSEGLVTLRHLDRLVNEVDSPGALRILAQLVEDQAASISRLADILRTFGRDAQVTGDLGNRAV